MLNGKFFSGLPPKMMDRGSGTRGENRQESHFFWPDDTKVESVLETRVRRRNSLQLEPTEQPRLQQRVSLGENEVDTRKMFHKEFAKSSIQFCDNIQEEVGGDFSHQRRPLRATKSMRQEITKKPTATKIELPESVIDAAYTSAKKKQAYTSTIEFYDYADEEPNQRNNMRRPKMDMNDKRDVERNSKNSPKLQVKGNARNLRIEDKQNNDSRDLQQYTPKKNFEIERENFISPQRVIRNPVFEDKNTGEAVKPRTRNFIEENIRNVYYDHEVEIPEYRIGKAGFIEEHQSANRIRSERLPKKILKNITQDEVSRSTDYKNYRDEELADVNHIDHGMRNVRVRTSPKKHVTYRDETFANEEELPVPRHYYGRDYEFNDGADTTANVLKTTNSRAKMSNTKTGSRNDIRQQFRPNTPDFNQAKNIDPYQYMVEASNSSSNNTVKRSLNNSYNSNNRLKNEQRKISPKITAAPATITTTTTMSEQSAADAQKHLRSSIGFNNGEIVADNDDSTATTKTPTANSSQRRNARNSAANKRVSVGLPD